MMEVGRLGENETWRMEEFPSFIGGGFRTCSQDGVLTTKHWNDWFLER